LGRQRGQRYSHETLRSVPKSAQAWTSLSLARMAFLLSGRAENHHDRRFNGSAS
jgi:hypothetical protein